MQYENIKGAPFRWLFVDAPTLAQYCEKTGWYVQKIFEDKDGQYLVQLQSLL
jgi:hypothetical protein